MTDGLREKLEGQGVNMQETMERFVGMDSLYIKFLKKFLDDQNYMKLASSASKGEVEEAFTAAHTLKGVVGNLGFGQLFDALVPLVESLREGDMDRARKQMPEIEREYEAVCQIIREELKD